MKQRPQQPRPPRAMAQRGVSLIEVLIAILIFSFGVLGLVGLQAKAVSYSTGAENTNRAALLANEASSSMWNSGSLTLPAASVTAWQARVADTTKQGLPGPGQGTIVVNGGVAEITIKWRAPTAASAASSPWNQYVTQVMLPPS